MLEENEYIDILSMCLNCRKKLEIPIRVYDEMGKCVFHEELNKEINTLKCNECNLEKVVPIISIDDEYLGNDSIDKINKLISVIDKDEMKDILINIMNNVPLSEQERFYMISLNSLGNLGKKEKTFRRKFEEVKKDFDSLTYDNIYVEQKNYSNSFYDEPLYELPDKLFNLLNNAYVTMKDCLYHKHYKKVTDICKLILNNPYVCNDGYIVDLYEIDNLPFDLDDIYKCYLYALIVVGNIKLFPKIEQLLAESNLNLEDVFYVGIKNIDKELFFKHWSNYLDSKYNYSFKKKK